MIQVHIFSLLSLLHNYLWIYCSICDSCFCCLFYYFLSFNQQRGGCLWVCLWVNHWLCYWPYCWEATGVGWRVCYVWNWGNCYRWCLCCGIQLNILMLGQQLNYIGILNGWTQTWTRSIASAAGFITLAFAVLTSSSALASSLASVLTTKPSCSSTLGSYN